MAPNGQLRSKNRTALLGVYAALDAKNKFAGGKLTDVLHQLGVKFDGPLEPYSQLRKAAEHLDQEDCPIHRIHLAGATMKLLRDKNFDPPAGDDRDELRPVVDQLVASSHRGTDTVDEVYSQIARASSAERFHNRWAQVNKRREEEASAPLDPMLSMIEDSRVDIAQRPRINTGLFTVEGEVVSRIETSFVVKTPNPDLQKIAPALLPHNWPRCNDFFCSLVRVEDRDRDVPGVTGGKLSAELRHWRGVYQERVGGCPDGWFPDTFLVFTWDRYADRQLILRYELAKRRANDRTVLRIDEGHIQVNRLHHGYEVSTLKYLLFDDEFMPGGGQTMAAIAPQLGWLEQSINQFGPCAQGLGGGDPEDVTAGSPVVGARDSIGAGLREVLSRAEAHLQETTTSTDAQCSKIVSKIRDGQYGLNDLVGDWGEVVLRVMRDTSRASQNQIDYARESLELANLLFPRGRG